MATVVDALVVELGLDPKALRKGAQQVQTLFGNVTSGAGKMSAGVSKATDTAADSFRHLERNALAFLAVLTGGKALKAFVSDTTASNVAAGQKTAALSKQIADNQFAAQASAGGAGASTAAAASTDATAKETAKPTTPDGLLASGKAALQKKDYAEAQSDAESALKNAKGAFKVDAQFLLAQSLAGQKQYRQSAVAYYDAYRQAPKSGRAPDALLGVSASLLALGDKKASCEALSKLKTEFPTPSTRVAHAAEVYAKRGGCE